MKLRGQSVWQVLGLYLAGGWVLLQVVDVLVDNVGLPPRVFTLALVLLAIGFPIALVTAVVQGSGRASGASDEAAGEGDRRPAGTARALFTWKNVAIGALLASALWGVVAIGWMMRSGGAAERLGRALEELAGAANDCFSSASTIEELEEARIEFLGAKNGKFKTVQKQLGAIDKSDKPVAGKKLNEVKNAIQSGFDAAHERLG